MLPYRAETWTPRQWDDEYRSGRLARYEVLDELGRYSVAVGYLHWLADERGPLRVLDVGCGTGTLRTRLDPARVAGFVGVDLSAPAIDEARHRHPGDHFVVGDVHDASLGVHDVVVLNEMLYYVDELDPFLARIGALVDEGGAVVVSMWRHPGDRTRWRALDAAWTAIDRVEVRNRANAVNDRGWAVGLYRPVSPG